MLAKRSVLEDVQCRVNKGIDVVTQVEAEWSLCNLEWLNARRKEGAMFVVDVVATVKERNSNVSECASSRVH